MLAKLNMYSNSNLKVKNHSTVNSDDDNGIQ